jgi:ferredoxin
VFSRRIVLHFPDRLLDQPIICKLVKDYDLEFNILKASVTPKEEGLLVLELRGEKDSYEQGVGYLKKMGVRLQPLSQDVVRNEEKCTHCGVCVPVCPTAALEVEPSTRKVDFKKDKCIACEICVNVCPVRAMEISF